MIVCTGPASCGVAHRVPVIVSLASRASPYLKTTVVELSLMFSAFLGQSTSFDCVRIFGISEAVEDFRSMHAKGLFKCRLDIMWSRASEGFSRSFICYLHSKADVFFIRRQDRDGIGMVLRGATHQLKKLLLHRFSDSSLYLGCSYGRREGVREDSCFPAL